MNVKNRVQVPKSTNTAGCNGNMLSFLLFLRGKHKFGVFSSILKVVQKISEPGFKRIKKIRQKNLHLINLKNPSKSWFRHWFVTQLDAEYRSFTPGVVSSSLTGPTIKVALADMAVCIRLQTGIKKFESSARLMDE